MSNLAVFFSLHQPDLEEWVFKSAKRRAVETPMRLSFQTLPFRPRLSGSHRSTHIASDLVSRALASQAKPQRESESQAFRIARS